MSTGVVRVHRGGLTRGRGGRIAGAAAVAAVVVAGLAGCSTDAADQQVVDRLSQLDVMTVPAGATAMSRTSLMGGGNIAVRNASGVTLVYATAQTPAEVGQYYHSRFDPTWHFKDNGAVVPGGWRASGSPGPDPNGYRDDVAEVVARGVTSADNAPAGSQSVVTVTASATRPA